MNSAALTTASPGGPLPNAAATGAAGADRRFRRVCSPARQSGGIVLRLMAGLVAAAATALVVAKVDIVVSANGYIVTSDSEIVVQPLETR